MYIRTYVPYPFLTCSIKTIELPFNLSTFYVDQSETKYVSCVKLNITVSVWGGGLNECVYVCVCECKCVCVSVSVCVCVCVCV